MLQWILCDNEHARLPDAWELSTSANEVGSCFACGAAARLQPIPAEEKREVELRPANIVFTGRGVAKLVDFESVTRRDRRGRAASNGGDPRYVAPEQWLGEDQKVGPAADIFGLGAILFHALTGGLTFDGICGDERIRRAITLPVPSVTAVRPSLPAALDAICRKCLQPQAENRYAHACELANDLRRI